MHLFSFCCCRRRIFSCSVEHINVIKERREEKQKRQNRVDCVGVLLLANIIMIPTKRKVVGIIRKIWRKEMHSTITVCIAGYGGDVLYLRRVLFFRQMCVTELSSRSHTIQNKVFSLSICCFDFGFGFVWLIPRKNERKNKNEYFRQ